MSSTATDIQARIDAIDTQIDALIADPDAMVSYRMGAKEVSRSEKLDGLLRLREHYVRVLAGIPSESLDSVALEISPFGEDLSKYSES